MYSYGPPHMAEQKQDDQLEHTYNSSVRIRDVALKTCQRRWTIGRSGERGSGIFVLAARHDDDDIYIHIYTHTHTLMHLYIRGAFNKVPDFFIQAFKIVIDSWKFSMLLLYILGDDWSIFMISASNEQLQQQLEYTLLKPDRLSWWISKIQSGREDTLEEKMPQKRMECFRLLFGHLAWIEHQFLSGIRDSRKAGSL